MLGAAGRYTRCWIGWECPLVFTTLTQRSDGRSRSGHGRRGWQTLVEVMGTTTLADPSNRELAAAFGVTVDAASAVFDLAIVGAGPAGLGAAVYGASEGLHTLVLEAEAFGGQAGTSSMIRNYLGFPRGSPAGS